MKFQHAIATIAREADDHRRDWLRDKLYEILASIDQDGTNSWADPAPLNVALAAAGLSIALRLEKEERP